MLAAFILANPEKYNPILPNYFISEDAVLSQIVTPIFENANTTKIERHGGSFWLRIND